MAYHLYPQAQVLFRYVQITSPEVYLKIQNVLRPHRIESLYRILHKHLRFVDLQTFNNQPPQRIATFLLEFVKCIQRNLPSPGEAFGIQLTCRITKNDTQDTLDSRHLREDHLSLRSYHTQDMDLMYELNLFTLQSQILEMSNRRKYSSIYVKNYTVQQLLHIFSFDSCHFWKGAPYNKGFDFRGYQVYLNTCRFLIVPHHNDSLRIIYVSSSRDLNYLLKHLDGSNIQGFNDVKYIFKKCGVVSFFFNMVSIIQMNLLDRPLHDLIFITKYQCRTGTPLPFNRDGLAAHPNRSPLDVLSFEAPKKNLARFCTEQKDIQYPVSSSTDKIFFGQQFNEGTGYNFSILPDNRRQGETQVHSDYNN